MAGVDVDDPNADAGERVADFAALGSDLAESRSAKILAIHRDDRRALRAAVALERTDTELVLEGKGDALLKLLSADEHVLQRAEALGLAAAHVGLQKSGRGDEECDVVLLDKRADGLCVERIDVEDDSDALDCGQPEPGHETEGVKEGQDAKNLVTAIEHEHLVDLADIRHDVEVREHDALGIAGAAAGKDDGCQLIHLCGAAFAGCKFRLELNATRTECAFEQAGRHEPREHERSQLLAETRRGEGVFEQHGPARDDHVREAFEKGTRRDHDVDAALLRAARNDFVGRGVIQVDRHAAREHERVVGESAGDTGGNEHADHGLLANLAP